MALKPKQFMVLALSDVSFHTPGDLTAPGFRTPGCYKWSAEVQQHILDGRLFDPLSPKDGEDFNKAAQNACRAYHKYHYPVPMFVTRMVESGFDEPEPVTVVVPAGEPIPSDAIAVQPVQPEPPEPLAPPATPVARRKAQHLGVDLELLRGRGTGAGGIITTSDVEQQWRSDTGNAEPDQKPQGRVSMAELLTPSTP